MNHPPPPITTKKNTNWQTNCALGSIQVLRKHIRGACWYVCIGCFKQCFLIGNLSIHERLLQWFLHWKEADILLISEWCTVSKTFNRHHSLVPFECEVNYVFKLHNTYNKLSLNEISKTLNSTRVYQILSNTSLAARGTLSHCLQRRTACNTSPPA